jgi:hypothetical protein
MTQTRHWLSTVFEFIIVVYLELTVNIVWYLSFFALTLSCN